MAKARVELDYKGFNEYRNSPEVTAMIEELTQDVAKRAGVKSAKVTHKTSRVVGKISTRKWGSNNLLKALTADGGTVKKHD